MEKRFERRDAFFAYTTNYLTERPLVDYRGKMRYRCSKLDCDA